MFDFGDELTVGGNRIPWLLWIQIIVLFLLLIILFCLSFFPSDLSDTTGPSSSASSSAAGVFTPLNSHINKQTFKHNEHTTTATTCVQHSQGHQNRSIKEEITTNTGRIIVSEDDFGNSAYFTDFHPCNYFRLAKLAFLKCFGLDSMSDDSLNSEKQKKER
ncbi:Transmembrane protein [Salix suchowensis]|nr:Transmembrane protein [Salix suchowensis]